VSGCVENFSPSVHRNIRIVHIYNKTSSKRSDQRKATDRRKEIISWPTDRRVRPDRRVNNISVEWIPFDEVNSHPITKDAFCSASRKDKTTVQLCDKGTRLKSHEMNIFRRNQRANVEERTITDRRTKDIKLPYNRRVRPDRRLNNISVEWITFE
jgi:hypothetical protein